MHHQGLTPTVEQIKEARGGFQERPGLMVMIRPRAGDFYYTESELQLMCEQIKMAAEAGADGVVLGVLRQTDGRVATQALQQLMTVSQACHLQTTFHRAFDAAPDQLEALDLLIEAGVDRVLTSGVAWGSAGTAVEGLPMLRKLVGQADGRIEIVVGGGVNRQNGAIILRTLAAKPEALPTSLHAYSGIQEKGRLTASAVRAFVAVALSGGT